MSTAKALKSIREKLRLNQAQMAGLLGLNRSYLAELETGRRPVKDWIVKKAQVVERRMGGINLTAPKAGNVEEVEDLIEFSEAIGMLTTDELGEIADHLTESLHDVPPVALLFYRSALKICHTEIRRRLISAHQINLKAKSKSVVN